MDCIEEHFIFRRENGREEWRTTEKVSVRIYRKQKGRQSMMSTRDDEPFLTVLYLLWVPVRLRVRSATRVRAEKCTERAYSFSVLWVEKRREIVVAEFMGDGWRGSEKVLNREEQINAMLSRPFYQPFNIIGSRVRSLACAA